MKKINLLLVIILFIFFSKNVFAFSNLAVKISEPKSPTNQKSFSLSFVVLDVQNRDLVAKCFVKKPGNSDFIQFDSTKSILSGGNSGVCNVSSSDLNSVGNFEFFVLIETLSESVKSNIVSVNFDDQRPEKIVFYQKNLQADSCSYEIKFKTANDNQTNKVVLYRLTDENIIINNDTKIIEKAMSPNQEGSIFTSIPDCNKNYYFFLRAFDNANNGSELVGDTILDNDKSKEVIIEDENFDENIFEPLISENSQVNEESELVQEGEVLGDDVNVDVNGEAATTENIVSQSFLSKYKNIIIFVFIVLFSYFSFNFIFNKSSKK